MYGIKSTFIIKTESKEGLIFLFFIFLLSYLILFRLTSIYYVCVTRLHTFTQLSMAGVL